MDLTQYRMEIDRLHFEQALVIVRKVGFRRDEVDALGSLEKNVARFSLPSSLLSK